MYNLRHRRRAVQGHTIIQPMQTMDRDGLSVEWINGHKGMHLISCTGISLFKLENEEWCINCSMNSYLIHINFNVSFWSIIICYR